jgi:hypothetical protein
LTGLLSSPPPSFSSVRNAATDEAEIACVQLPQLLFRLIRKNKMIVSGY